MWSAVERVAEDGMAKCLQMNPNLMGTACLDTYLDEGELSISGRMNAFQHSDVGEGGANPFAFKRAASGHSGATNEISTDGKVDGGVFAPQRAMDQSDVSLFKLTAGEHLAQFSMCTVIFGDNNDATGLFVQTVDDPWAQFAPNMGEFVEVMQKSVDEGSVITFVLLFAWRGGACARVDHHAGRLIDDGETIVFKENRKGNVFRKGMKRRRVRGAIDLDGFPTLQLQFCLGSLATNANLAMFDKHLDACAADIRNRLREVLIQAKAGGLWGRSKGPDAILSFVVDLKNRNDGRRRSFDARVARYSGLTVRRRCPLGSIFLDGMGNQLSRLLPEKSSKNDHTES